MSSLDLKTVRTTISNLEQQARLVQSSCIDRIESLKRLSRLYTLLAENLQREKFMLKQLKSKKDFYTKTMEKGVHKVFFRECLFDPQTGEIFQNEVHEIGFVSGYTYNWSFETSYFNDSDLGCSCSPKKWGGWKHWKQTISSSVVEVIGDILDSPIHLENFIK